MATYINDKSKAFLTLGDPTGLPTKKRSELRLKLYHSTTDARAWSLNEQENKEYIIDLMHQEFPKSFQLGKYVPIEVLIDTLLSNKNADIKKCYEKIKRLEKFLDEIELTPEQRCHLQKLKDEFAKGDNLIINADLDEVPPTDATTNTDKSPPCLPGPPTKTDRVTGRQERLDGSQRSTPSSKKVTTELSPQKQSSKHTKDRTDGTRDGSEGVEKEGPDDTSKELEIYITDPQHLSSLADEDIDLMNSDLLREKLKACRDAMKVQKDLARKAIEQLEMVKFIIEERDNLRQKLQESEAELKKIKAKQCKGKETCEEEIKDMEDEVERMRQSGKIDELEVLSKELQLLKKYCEKLNNIKDENKKLKTENDELKNILSNCGCEDGEELTPSEELKRLRQLKAQHNQVVSINDGLNRQRSESQTDDRDETDMEDYYKQQVQLLNQKVEKLKDITYERDQLQQSVIRLETELRKYGEIHQEVEVFRRRSKMLDDIMLERDSLHKRLDDMRGLEDEVMQLKRKANRVDELERLLAEARKNIEHYTEECRCENSSREQDMMKQLDDNNHELETLRYRAKEAEILRIERDRLLLKVDECNAMEKEFRDIQDKARTLEAVQQERDACKTKCNELECLVKEMETLRCSVDRCKTLQHERDSLLRRVRDLECVIADQENEINRLVAHIDRLSKGQEKQQDLMKKVVGNLRTEIDKKDSLIQASEEQLAQVQDQLMSTIGAVSNDTDTLKKKIEQSEQRIARLEKELQEKMDELSIIRKQLEDRETALSKERGSHKDFQDRENLIEKLKSQLDELREENERLRKLTERMRDLTDNDKMAVMLKKSKNAVKKISEELSKYKTGETEDLCARKRAQRDMECELQRCQLEVEDECQDWKNKVVCLQKQVDEMKKQMANADRAFAENEALRRHSTEIQEVAKDQIQDLVEELKNAKLTLEQLRKENDILRNSKCDDQKECDDLRKQLAMLKGKATDADCVEFLDEISRLKSQLDSAMKAGSSTAELLMKENQDLKTQITSLKKQLASAGEPGDDSEDYKRQIEKLMLDLEKCRKSLDECRRRDTGTQSSDENARLKAEIDRLNAEKGDCSDLQKKVDQCRHELEGAIKENEALKRELEGVKIPVSGGDSRLKDAFDDAQRQIDSLKRELNEARADTSIQDENADLRREIAALKKKMEQSGPSGDSGSKLAAEKQELQRQLDALQNELDAYRRELENNRRELDANRKELESTRQEADKYKNDAEANRLQLEGVQKDLDAARSAGGDNLKLVNEIAELKKQLEAARQNADGDIAKMRADLDKARGDADKFKADADKFKSDYERLKGDGDKYKADADRYKADADKYKADADSAKANADKLKADADKYKADADNYKAEADKLRSEIDKLKADMAKQGAPDTSRLDNEIADLKKQAEQLRRDLDQASGDRDRARAEADQAKKDLVEARRAAEGGDALTKQINDLQSEIERLKKELSDANRRADESNKKLEESTRKLMDSADTGLPEKEMKEKQDLLDMIAKLEGQVAAMSKDKDSAYADLNRQLEEQKNRAKACEDALSTNDAGAAIKKLQNELFGKEEELKKCKDRVRELEDELSKMKVLENQLEQTKRQSLQAIKKVQDQFEKEVSSLQDKYNSGIEKLQHSHEEIVNKNTADYEREVEELRNDAIVSKMKIASLQSSVSGGKKPPKKLAMSRTQVTEIQPEAECDCDPFRRLIKQILAHKLESLSFEDLQFMHTKVCDATAKVISGRSDVRGMYKNVPMAADHDLRRRQKIAQGQMAKLQLEVALERQRLEDLKKTLEVEKITNTRLAERIRTQTRTVNTYMNTLERSQSKNLTVDKHTSNPLGVFCSEKEKKICPCKRSGEKGGQHPNEDKSKRLS